MLKRKLTLTDYFLIFVNLIPLWGVWFEGWDPKQMFLVYCLETVIIGIVNVLKMAFVTLFVKPTDVWENGGSTSMQSGWLFIFFFIFHYGFFVFIQTQIFFSVSNMLPDSSLFTGYKKIPGLLGENGILMLMIFIAYYTVQTIFTFFKSGDYKTISLGRLMFSPYLRIFIQQFVVILGAMILTFGGGKLFMLVFVVVKVFFELFINFDKLLILAEKRQKIKRKNESIR